MSEFSSASLPSESTDAPDAAASSGFQFSDLLTFEKMIVPLLVKFAYYVGCVIAIIAGLFAIYEGASSRYGGGFQVISGVLTLVLGPLFVRIVCEQIIVLFGIYDRLGEIRDQRGTE